MASLSHARKPMSDFCWIIVIVLLVLLLLGGLATQRHDRVKQ